MGSEGFDNQKFEMFDKQKIEEYKKEVKEKWGGTDAFKEAGEKTAGRTAAQENDIAAGLMEIFRELGALKGKTADADADVQSGSSPEAPEVQAKVAQLQQYITDNYYTCTKDILKGLGQMYTADERFRSNIDKAGGEGTAEFAAKAIAAYCN